jgi:hypothetical protein
MIRYVFGADTKPFKHGLNDMRSRVQRFASSAAAMMLKAFAVTAIIAGFRSLIKRLDETAKMARRLGSSGQEIQRIEFAADRAGASMSGLVRALEKANREMIKARGGNDQLMESFDRLGLANQDMMDLEGTLLALAANIEENGISAQLLSDAYDIFGRSSEDAIKIAINGQQALQAEFDKANTQSDKAFKTAEKFQNAMAQIKNFFMGFFNILFGLFQIVGTILGTLASNIVTLFTGLAMQLKNFGIGVGRTLKFDFSGAKEAFRNMGEEGKRTLRQLGAEARAAAQGMDEVLNPKETKFEKDKTFDAEAGQEEIDAIRAAEEKADADREDRIRRLADLTKQVNDAMEAARIKALSDEARLIELKERELELQKQINDEGLDVEAQLEAGKELIAVANERRDIEDAAGKRQEDHDNKMADLRSAEIDAQQDLAFSRMSDEEKLQDLVARRNKLMDEAGDDDTEDAIQQRIAALGLDQEIDRMVDAMRDGKGGMTTPGSIAATGLAAIGGGGSANLLAAGRRNHEQNMERLLAGILAGVTTGDDGTIKQYREPVA